MLQGEREGKKPEKSHLMCINTRAHEHTPLACDERGIEMSARRREENRSHLCRRLPDSTADILLLLHNYFSI